MIFLASLCLIVSVCCFWYLITTMKFSTKKEKIITLVVGILALVLFIAFLGVEISSGSGGSSNRWDDLTDEEKEWYHNNYGNGQYDKYQDAINDYKNK
ncbi:MAG: hypothetical protein E7624_07440 [Ruminococcaceae bacterium]|nr:hypothetical protein [Oscillospiraceae bacterium]